MGLSSLGALLAGESLPVLPPPSQASLRRTAARSGSPCCRSMGPRKALLLQGPRVRARLRALESAGFWDLPWASLIQHAFACAVGLLLSSVRDA